MVKCLVLCFCFVEIGGYVDSGFGGGGVGDDVFCCCVFWVYVVIWYSGEFVGGVGCWYYCDVCWGDCCGIGVVGNGVVCVVVDGVGD